MWRPGHTVHAQFVVTLDVDANRCTRSAFATAHRQLTRTREKLHECGILGGLGKVRIDPDDDYQQAHQTVAQHLAAERALSPPSTPGSATAKAPTSGRAFT